MIQWTIENAGPDALIIRFGDRIDSNLVPVIRAAKESLIQELTYQIIDLVPSYTTLMVCYDPRQNDHQTLTQKITKLLSGLQNAPANPGKLVEIPVWYDPSVGPDLERVASHHQITIEEVIQRHTQQEYQVYAIGFAPGFAYLGKVAPSLATPRLATPRKVVPAGSVALAEEQTAIYPISTPGGWNLLGKTPAILFDPETAELGPFATGDRVRFGAITRAEFIAAGGEL